MPTIYSDKEIRYCFFAQYCVSARYIQQPPFIMQALGMENGNIGHSYPMYGIHYFLWIDTRLAFGIAYGFGLHFDLDIILPSI